MSRENARQSARQKNTSASRNNTGQNRRGAKTANRTTPGNSKNSRKRRRRKRRLKIIFFLEFLLLAVLLCGLFLFFKIDSIKNYELKDVKVNAFHDPNIDDYQNIAVFGVDSREGKLVENCRSDSIMVVSIHKKTKDVKVLSIFRDTLVHIDDTHGYEKITHAYAYGGPDLAVNTINENYDLNIRDFITVNYSALTNVIDALGGVEIEIKDEELDYVNDYTKDVAKVSGIDYTKIKSPGKQTITGVQATGYCRVRYTAGGDYTRAERQRTVLHAILTKAKKANPFQLVQVANEITPQIYTSLTSQDMMRLGIHIFSYDIKKQKGFPFELNGETINGTFVNRPVTVSSNVKELHKFLFGTEDYTPSDRVQELSGAIEGM